MNKVVLYFNSLSPAFSQLITGLEILKERQEITLEYRLDLFSYPVHIFKIDFNGLSVFFDMADNSDINKKVLDESDFYVKRMLLKSDFEKNEKLIPFGFNYSVLVPNSFMKSLFLRDKRLWKYSLKYFKSISKIAGINDSLANNNLNNMSAEPSGNNRIIFRSRLWDPDRNDTSWKKEERKLLNKQRIELNRNLKNKYPDFFTGGINRDYFSEKQCPDLLLSKREYHKGNYLKTLKNSGIGIVNKGLEDSIGWKLGEYVAHSLAIITTPIEKYKLLGEFLEGKNYLAFDNLNECLEKAELLFSNESLRNTMQEENWKYYLDYLHPANKLERIFHQIKIA